MEQGHIKELLPEYLDRQLNSFQSKIVEKHLAVCPECQQEKTELEVLLGAFDSEREIEPSGLVRKEFHKMLENEKQKYNSGNSNTIQINRNKNSKTLRKVLKAAAVVSLLLCSYLLGKFHQSEKTGNNITENSENKHQQNEMLALLENTSASKRIQGVSYFEDFQELDKAIMKALTERMFNDENKNVRLTAVEALGKFTTSKTVKKNLISALEKEKDPVIQIAIIQILVQIQETKAVEPMKNLLQKKETEQFVKEHIKALLPSLI